MPQKFIKLWDTLIKASDISSISIGSRMVDVGMYPERVSKERLWFVKVQTKYATFTYGDNRKLDNVTSLFNRICKIAIITNEGVLVDIEDEHYINSIEIKKEIGNEIIDEEEISDEELFGIE